MRDAGLLNRGRTGARRGRLALAPRSDPPSVASSEARADARSARKRESDARNLGPHRFKPGQSGNPSGRLKGLQSVPALVDRALQEIDPASGITRLEQLVESFADACVRCEPWALKMLLDRIWPVTRTVDLCAQPELTDADREAFSASIERQLAAREPPCP